VKLTAEQLTGRDEAHLEWEDGIGLVPQCRVAFTALQARAREVGFDLQVASGFRSFERQLAIWNAKASGDRPVHDDENRPVDMQALGEEARIHAILRYSALPGTSRHHWGSDLDVYDAAAMPKGYRLQLTPEEVAEQGMFGPLHAWLDGQMAAGEAEGFYRPYDVDRGGVAVERWHLSYAPCAAGCESGLSEELLAEVLGSCRLVLGDRVLAELPALFRRYVREVSPVPDMAL
jgi:LAS superfamily LD-carboxypeptidase LdcB